MRQVFALPATLLALLATTDASAQNSPRPADLHPEHQRHLKREQQAQDQLQWQQPLGMRKMSGDEGEKFFLHYWNFGDLPADATETLEEFVEEVERYANASLQLSAPIAPHFERANTFRRFPGYSLFARGWGSCPSGTKSCTEIDRPDNCCSVDDDCIKVDDTGNGDVGCCPQGGSCGGSISDCNESAGQTSCPESDNKGCCIEGYACFDVGCVWASTQTTTTNLPVQTVTQGRTNSAPSPSSSSRVETETVAVAGQGSTYTTTIENTVTETAPGTTSVGTVTQPTTVTVTESPSETTEPPPDTETTEEPSPTTSSDETEALPPARPTGSSDTDESTTTEEPSPTADGCPTGFYMCSAYYLGGCCRVGRNCDTTSCPSNDATQVNSNGVTVAGGGGVAASTSTTTVDPDETSATEAATGEGSGSCASGWMMCGQNEGGGCCPSGYVCGASCTATASGVDNTAKRPPSAASTAGWAWSLILLAVGSGVGMILL